jgi:hypothetical protein
MRPLTNAQAYAIAAATGAGLWLAVMLISGKRPVLPPLRSRPQRVVARFLRRFP